MRMVKNMKSRIFLSGEMARLSLDVGGDTAHIALLPVSYLVNIYEMAIDKLEARRA